MIADLRREGISLIDGMVGAAEMFAYLHTRPTYPGHVKGASVATHYLPGNVTCWAAEDVLRAPHFFEFALGLTGVAREYLGCDPVLYSLNAFTTYPIAGPMNPDIQDWHRDKDDTRFVALFVYLTDVFRDEDGAHLFQTGSHTGEAIGIQTVLGGAGTAFLADTRGLHKGIRPTATPRTMAWARWGVSDPPASYLWDQQTAAPRQVLGDRYPTDPALQAAMHLVVQ